MIHELNLLPVKLSAPAKAAIADEKAGLRKLHRFCQPVAPDQIVIKALLPPAEPAWFHASLSPCLFVAAGIKDRTGQYQEARIGHFTARFMKAELRSFLPKAPDTVWFAGMAQRSSHESLKESIEKILAVLGELGIKIEVKWQHADRPLLSDTRTGKLISDLGLGIQNGSSLNRQTFYGVSSEGSLLISLLFADYGLSQPIIRSTLFTDPARNSLEKQKAPAV